MYPKLFRSFHFLELLEQKDPMRAVDYCIQICCSSVFTMPLKKLELQPTATASDVTHAKAIKLSVSQQQWLLAVHGAQARTVLWPDVHECIVDDIRPGDQTSTRTFAPASRLSSMCRRHQQMSQSLGKSSCDSLSASSLHTVCTICPGRGGTVPSVLCLINVLSGLGVLLWLCYQMRR